MIFGVLILVVIGVGVGVALMMKSKGASADDSMMSVPSRPAAAEPAPQTLSERLEQHTNVTSVPRSPHETVEPPVPAPVEPAEPRAPTPFELSPDLTLPSADPEPGMGDGHRDGGDGGGAPAGADVPAAPPVVEAPVVEAPVVEDDRPEPMVRARVQPAATPKPSASPRTDDDEDAVVTRLRVPGQRPVKVVDPPRPEPAVPAATADRGASTGDAVGSAVGAEDAASPLPSFLSPPGPAEDLDPAPAATTPTPEPAAVSEPTEPELSAPEPIQAAATEPELSEPDATEPEASEPEASEPALAAAPVADAAGEAGSDADAASAAPAAAADLPADDVFAALYEAQISGDLGLIDDEPAPTAAGAGADVLAASEPADGDAAAGAVEIEPEVSAGTTPPPVQFVLEPEPEADPVDHILKALVNRAKARQVGIAEVAAELVEQANLEDRDIDEVLADLVDRVDEDDEQVDPAARLEELTFFNESVPRRPGQITDYDRLDKAAKKKVIIRVLCLLVAMQEDNRLKPSEPRSEAETRHWPLARAVWPVPVGQSAEAEAAAAESAGDDAADGDKKLPGRRLLRTTKR